MTPTLRPDASGRPRPDYRPILSHRHRRRGRGAALVSLAIHGLLVALLFLPPFLAETLDLPLTEGAGGRTPAGGGGGGTGGTGGERIVPERITYVQMAPAPAPPPVKRETPTPTVTTPKPSEPVKPPEPKPPQPEAAPLPAPVTPTPAAAPTAGVGGGSGNDRSTGSGPGSGGGVGSGVGTGRGSGTGPGTGGGGNEIYPPTVTTMALLPMPVPNKVRPYTMIAWFDVDERGGATLIAFNPSKDAGYNKRIRERLAEYRFRPAVRADGTPVRDTVSVTVNVPD